MRCFPCRYDECEDCFKKSLSRSDEGMLVRLRKGCRNTSGVLGGDDGPTGKILRVDIAEPGTLPYLVEGPGGATSWYPGDELVHGSAISVDAAWGMRAVRGRDWAYAAQDEAGGRQEGGTVNGPYSEDGWVVVQWDSGTSYNYRLGADGKFDVDLVVGRSFRLPIGTTVRLNSASKRTDGPLGAPAHGKVGLVTGDDHDGSPFLVATRGGATGYYSRSHGQSAGSRLYCVTERRDKPVGGRDRRSLFGTACRATV